MASRLEDDLYNAISNAEFRDGTPADQRWIRTRHRPPKGSSAFGPVQITATKGLDYARRGLLSPEGSEYTQRVLAPLWANFVQGDNYKQAPWNYGGPGNFKPEDRGMYEKVAKEMLMADWNASQGNRDEFVRLWRGARRRADPAYYKAVDNALSGSPPVQAKAQPKIDFSSAFANARRAGKKTFEWKGKPYTTQLA